MLTGETGTLALNRRPIWMRSIGAVYSSEIAAALQEPVLLPLDYDGIIWFAGTRESRLLPFN